MRGPERGIAEAAAPRTDLVNKSRFYISRDIPCQENGCASPSACPISSIVDHGGAHLTSGSGGGVQEKGRK